MNRRQFTQSSAAAILAALAQAEVAAQGGARVGETEASKHEAAMKEAQALGANKRLKIAFLIYPGMFLQDLVGPLTVFEALMQRDIFLVWKDTKPLPPLARVATPLINVTPNMSFYDCPDDLDVICVPGGAVGTVQAMQDEAVLGFLRTKGSKAKFITSVCTGSLILGAAGLLKGYRATTHWVVRDVLSQLGATPVQQRIVEDRNRITGGGVTAGIDFGLAIAAKLASESYAKAIQLYIEYDPQPPFDSGSPEKAAPATKRMIEAMLASVTDSAMLAAKRANV
jgi:cyclohexyl-isocyanide hydratase